MIQQKTHFLHVKNVQFSTWSLYCLCECTQILYIRADYLRALTQLFNKQLQSLF